MTQGDTTICPTADTVTFMPDSTYTADYDEPNDIIHIHFEADIKENAEVFAPASPEPLKSLFERAQAAWADKTGAYYFNAASIVYEILAKLSDANTDSTSDTQKSFLSAVSYMHENYTDPELSVDSLVNVAHMSNTYFRKLFERKFGVTPSKYLTDLRAKHAGTPARRRLLQRLRSRSFVGLLRPQILLPRNETQVRLSAVKII